MLLTKNKIINIESFTTDLLQDSYRKLRVIPPIDLTKVIAYSGLKVEFGQFTDSDVLGRYFRDQKLIQLKADLPFPRLAFTAAHELGHYYLHKDRPAEVFYRKDFYSLNEEEKTQEQEANWFAASLLMPKQDFFILWRIIRNIDLLARRFGVSPAAAYFRLQNMSLI